MADEHIQLPPPQASPADAITAPPAPGTNGEAPPHPAAVPAPAQARPRRSLGHTLWELVWPSTGPVAQQTESAREVVETVVFVVVLVLLLKSFAAEAFVIPTGSMAETLWGYQKVVDCPECKHQFPINASQEADAQDRDKLIPMIGGVCPNCGKPIVCSG